MAKFNITVLCTTYETISCEVPDNLIESKSPDQTKDIVLDYFENYQIEDSDIIHTTAVEFEPLTVQRVN